MTTFSSRDLKVFYNLIEAPDLSKISCPNNNYTGIAKNFLRNYNILLTEEELRNLGIFIYKVIKISSKNKTIVENVVNSIVSRKKSLIDTISAAERRVKELKEENKAIKGDALEELSPQAQMWHNNIKFLGLKSCVVSWDEAVKDRSDIVPARNSRNRENVKNLPVFSVPETLLSQVGRSYEMFNPGLYEYLNFVMNKVEELKRRTEPSFTIDRFRFLMTSVKSINSIDEEVNLIAVNTNGEDRPAYKSIPYFMTSFDVKQEKETPQISKINKFST